MNLARRLRSISPREAQTVLVTAGRTLSVVGSENDMIARATSILFTWERCLCGPSLTPDQARDVLAWAGQTSET